MIGATFIKENTPRTHHRYIHHAAPGSCGPCRKFGKFLSNVLSGSDGGLRAAAVAARPRRVPDGDADRLASHIDAAFRTMLDPDLIRAIAEDLGAVERRSVYHPGVAVCAWVLSAFERGTDTEGRLLDAHRTYDQLGGRQGKRTAWRDLSLKLQPFFRGLLSRATRRWLARAPAPLRGRLAAFTDVLIPDGCAFKLANALSGVYKGTGTAAEFKLHAIYSVGSRSLTRLATSGGAVHDSDGLPGDEWQAGALYLWNLGYNDYGRFMRAARANAHIVQRLKDKANQATRRSSRRPHPRCRDAPLHEWQGDVAKIA